MTTAQPPEITAFPLFSRGKVRDVYDLGDTLLMVASDRVSAYDVVLPTTIPNKGAILTQLSIFWFNHLKVPHHFISGDVDDFPEALHPHREYLQGRSMLVKKAKRFDIECVARGYLTGSGWKDYCDTGAVCGHVLPANIQKSGRLDPPIFTPASKNDTGHDENIDRDSAAKIVGSKNAKLLEKKTLEIYSNARDYAQSKGIILADTKFEFGEVDGEVILIDEVLTPDSSRFWPADQYVVGEEPPSFDKQFVRNYLSTLDWDKTYPGPTLPQEIVDKTLDKYLEAYQLITGEKFSAR